MSRKLTLAGLIDKIFLMIMHDDDLDPDHKILLLLKVNEVRIALKLNDKPPPGINASYVKGAA